jgi:hypothetical protein
MSTMPSTRGARAEEAKAFVTQKSWTSKYLRVQKVEDAYLVAANDDEIASIPEDDGIIPDTEPRTDFNL